LIVTGTFVAFLAGWLLLIAARSSGKFGDTHAALRRPARVRMNEAAEGRIDRLREKTFAELEAMPAHEVRRQLSRRKRKYRVTTTKRKLETGALLFTVVARETNWLRPWVSAQLEEVFPPDHQPRKPLAPPATSLT
jgi:hypothetical protein